MKTLITTASKGIWRKYNNAILLGEWCKQYNEKANWNSKDDDTLPYHWNDKQKLSKDYDYLGDLYEAILSKLSFKLNEIHDVKFTQRYWRIVLGPWLSSYIAAVWDRWENINKAIALNEPMKTIVPDNSQATRLVPNNYLSAIRIMASSDDWNYLLYCSILKWQKNSNITLVKKSLDSLEVVSPHNITERSKSSFHKIVDLIDCALNKLWFNGDYQCVLYKSYLSPISLIKLSLRLRQPIRIFSEFEKEVIYSNVTSDHRSDKFWFRIRGDFEEFLCQQINKDIPRAYLEDFENIRNILKGVNYTSKAKIIMTANAHYHNEIFKVWTASMVEQGSKLIIAAHGGAMRVKFDTFGHEEDISDYKTTWHEPVHPKHIQLSPNKFFSKNTYSGKGKNITLIGLDAYRYANRFPTAPISSTFLVDFRQKVEFIKLVKGIGLKNLVVRAYANPWGWASRERYSDEFGQEIISNIKSIKKELLNSKIVICTYPQTTFSEAMHIGVPTLLMYAEKTWTLHDNFLPLLEEMGRVGIFHASAESAAFHIKKIHKDPLKWWNEEDTKTVRSMFDRICGAPAKDKRIDKEWGEFFTNILDQSRTLTIEP